MFVVILLNSVYLIVAGRFLHESGKVLAYNKRRLKKPPVSPYSINQNGVLTKDEFGHRFMVNIDSEFGKF